MDTEKLKFDYDPMCVHWTRRGACDSDTPVLPPTEVEEEDPVTTSEVSTIYTEEVK